MVRNLKFQNLQWLVAAAAVDWGLGMVEVDDLGAVGPVEDEFVVGQGLVQAGRQDGEGDVVFLFGAFDFDFRGEGDAFVIFVVGVAGVGDDIFGLVVDELAVGGQVEAAEDNLAGEPTVIPAGADNVNHVVGLFEGVAFFVGDGFSAIFQDRGFSGANLMQQ